MTNTSRFCRVEFVMRIVVSVDVRDQRAPTGAVAEIVQLLHQFPLVVEGLAA